MSDLDLSANVERFTGFAGCYDANRPKPPAVLAEILLRLAGLERAGVQRARLVVDLGCGTGLSTTYWHEQAEEIVGVEPSADMRGQAEARAGSLGLSAQVRFVEGFSHATGLPDGCADLVTCSQSLHWMDPEPTFAEVARILRPGGVFAAYDCDWPPIVDWEAADAFNETRRRSEEIGAARNAFAGVRRWAKEEHLSRLRASGRFRYCREILVHSRDIGSADRLVGLCLSQGSIATLMKLGVSEDELGVSRLREIARRRMGPADETWYWSYRVRIGVR